MTFEERRTEETEGKESKKEKKGKKGKKKGEEREKKKRKNKGKKELCSGRKIYKKNSTLSQSIFGYAMRSIGLCLRDRSLALTM